VCTQSGEAFIGEFIRLFDSEWLFWRGDMCDVRHQYFVFVIEREQKPMRVDGGVDDQLFVCDVLDIVGHRWCGHILERDRQFDVLQVDI
jgi:hypothetical protein